MKAVFAVTDACAGCGACIKTCPEKAIRPAPRDYGAPLLVLEDRCSGCAECAEVCPVSACVEVLLEALAIALETLECARRNVRRLGLLHLCRVGRCPSVCAPG